MATTKVDVGGPIAAGFGAIWVMSDQDSDGNESLREVNAATGRVTAAFDLTGEPVVACGALWTIDTVVGTGTPGVSVVSEIDPHTGRRLHRWPVIASGAGAPQDAADQCVSIATPEDAPLSSMIAAVSLDDGIGPFGPTIPTPVEVVSGAFWSVTSDGIVQRLDPNGIPIGGATTLPAPSIDNGDWRFVQLGPASWVIGQNGAYRVELAP